ncbi:MAG: tRNA-dihydrouridine synthase, partial [Desulfohalobiaceae bacterium]
AEFVSRAASRLDGLGLGWVALHPRSAGQGLSGSADWGHLRLLRERVPGVPLLASGDLHHAADGQNCLARCSADGVMYARGALANPAVFRDHFRMVQDGGGRYSGTDNAKRLEVARRHVHLCRRYADSRKNLLKMRTILPKYLKGFPEASAVRSRLVRASSWEEIESFLDGMTWEYPDDSHGLTEYPLREHGTCRK